MGVLLLAIFSIVAAGDIVDLEPVQAGTYDCDKLAPSSATAVDEARCNASPYCYFNSSDGSSGKCIDDPCLLTVLSATSNCDIKNQVNCGLSTLPTTSDCAEGSGSFCRALGKGANATTPDIYDYCFYAQLRDGSCPPSVCQVGTDNLTKKCIPRPISTAPLECQYLGNEDECKLTPKCMYRSGGCTADPCFFGSENAQCATWTNGDAIWEGGTLAAGDCVLYQPYKADGTVASYCVHKSLNKSPNLCYFLNPATDPSNATDYLHTYPTYNPLNSDNPDCSTSSIPKCDDNASGLCSTKVNSKGAFAGKYCGDATHGAASILHVPSLVVFLLAFIIVSKFTL